MGPTDCRPTGGICGYCKARNEENRRRRSSTGQCITTPYLQRSCAKLSKPPKVQTRREKPRNRLRKHDGSTSSLQLPIVLYVLQSEPYPYSTRPGEFLGVFSTIDSVTSAAIKHGAYSFSKEGLLDGSEYLSPTGRIKIIPKEVELGGVQAGFQEQKRISTNEAPRNHTERPNSHIDLGTERDRRTSTVYLAIYQAPDSLLCIGVFAKKNAAWGACLKNQAMFALSHDLRDGTRNTDQNGMPQASARVVGCGSHQWLVRAYDVERRRRRSS